MLPMPKLLAHVFYEESPILFDGNQIKLPGGWVDTEHECPDCSNNLISTLGLFICVACYIRRVQAHTGRTLLAQLQTAERLKSIRRNEAVHVYRSKKLLLRLQHVALVTALSALGLVSKNYAAAPQVSTSSGTISGNGTANDPDPCSNFNDCLCPQNNDGPTCNHYGE